MIDSLEKDFKSVDLSAADRAMLGYAAKLTVEPQKIDAPDVDTLKSCGFDDLSIHDICSIVGYFAFVNRIADGLGVELEDPGESG